MSLLEQIPGLSGWFFSRIRSRWEDVAAFSLAFRLINLVFLAPLSATALRLFLNHWGRASVGNFEVAWFLLSPTGLLALVVVGAVALAILYMELAGLMRLLGDHRVAWWHALTGPATSSPRLVWLGVWQLIIFLLLAAPFLIAIGVVYLSVWNGRDLNGLILLKPPAFWIGAGLAGCIVAVYLVIAGRLFLRWLFALPIVLFEPGVSVKHALSLSSERTAGQLRELGTAIVAWAAIQSALAAIVLGGLKLLSAWVLDRVGSSLARAVPATAALLTLHGLLLALLSIIGTVSFAGLVLAFYRQSSAALDQSTADREEQIPRLGFSTPSLIVGALLALLVFTTLACVSTLNGLKLEDKLQITAHRAGATNGPENSIAALKRAILDHADWAEIDVQRTSDDAVIVLHDTDLARIGGGNQQVGKTPLAQIQQLDIGSLHAPEFAGERVPTFSAFLEASRGQPIGLTVELKPHGKNDEEPLTRLTVAAIQEAGMVDQCRLCSQSYNSLMIARKLEPKLKVGWIGANAIGDLTKLDVDFLMLKSELCKADLVERAALRKIAVHAWTVNDPAWVAPLLDDEVENIITDDPAQMRARFEEIRGLSTIDRLLLRARNALLN